MQDNFRHPSQGMDFGGHKCQNPHCFFLLMINDIFDPDKFGTVTSHSEIDLFHRMKYQFLFHCAKYRFFFHLEISVFHAHLCNNYIYPAMV